MSPNCKENGRKYSSSLPEAKKAGAQHDTCFVRLRSQAGSRATVLCCPLVHSSAEGACTGMQVLKGQVVPCQVLLQGRGGEGALGGANATTAALFSLSSAETTTPKYQEAPRSRG